MDRLLNAEEVAAILGCSRQLVYVMGERGELPSYKIRNLRRFSESQIRAFMAEREQGKKVSA